VYYILKIVADLLIILTTRFRIQGVENIPSQGPVLVVANHLSVSDPVLLGVKLRRKIIFMAKEELFKNWFESYIVRQFGAFPVYRSRTNRDTLRRANLVLQQGYALGMFPEGKRSKEAHLMPALYGSALIAYHNKAPILPVGIIGTEKIKGFNWIWRRPEVTLVVGRVFHLPEEKTVLTKDQLAQYTEIIMKRIEDLLPEKYKVPAKDGGRG